MQAQPVGWIKCKYIYKTRSNVDNMQTHKTVTNSRTEHWLSCKSQQNEKHQEKLSSNHCVGWGLFHFHSCVPSCHFHLSKPWFCVKKKKGKRREYQFWHITGAPQSSGQAISAELPPTTPAPCLWQQALTCTLRICNHSIQALCSEFLCRGNLVVPALALKDHRVPWVIVMAWVAGWLQLNIVRFHSVPIQGTVPCKKILLLFACRSHTGQLMLCWHPLSALSPAVSPAQVCWAMNSWGNCPFMPAASRRLLYPGSSQVLPQERQRLSASLQH